MGHFERSGQETVPAIFGDFDTASQFEETAETYGHIDNGVVEVFGGFSEKERIEFRQFRRFFVLVGFSTRVFRRTFAHEIAHVGARAHGAIQIDWMEAIAAILCEYGRRCIAAVQAREFDPHHFFVELDVVSNHDIAFRISVTKPRHDVFDGNAARVAYIARDTCDFGDFRRKFDVMGDPHVGVVDFFHAMGGQIPYHVTELDDMGVLVDGGGQFCHGIVFRQKTRRLGVEDHDAAIMCGDRRENGVYGSHFVYVSMSMGMDVFYVHSSQFSCDWFA